MTDFRNVKVTLHSRDGDYCLQWETTEARYHVWVTRGWFLRRGSAYARQRSIKNRIPITRTVAFRDSMPPSIGSSPTCSTTPGEPACLPQREKSPRRRRLIGHDFAAPATSKSNVQEGPH